MMPETAPVDALPRLRVSGRTLIFCLAMTSLVIALAHRTFHVTSTVNSVFQSEACNVKVQHLSNDAHHWSLPERGALLPLSSAATGCLAREPVEDLSADAKRLIECRSPPVC
jgi:hypothetical protein